MPQLSAARTARSLLDRYREVRSQSHRLSRPLAIEDYVIQSMPDVSPAKWHLAHVSWFFETFVLKQNAPDYRTPFPAFEYLFNSYYNAVGEQHPRPERGLLSRPTVAEVFAYRAHIDQAMEALLECADELPVAVRQVIELGLHHEQQHQELLLMDIKHVLSRNPLLPAYRDDAAVGDSGRSTVLPREWIGHEGGVVEIGHAGEGFVYDNEGPRHEVLLQPFRLASRLTTNGEFLEFIEDGGYRRPEFWLADGWTTIGEQGWQAPLYWTLQEGRWREFTLNGSRPIDLAAPVCHVSYYEADAYATWAGARLPGEAEWEHAAAPLPIEGNFVEDDALHPRALDSATAGRSMQLFGDVWEWTRSDYAPYPGFEAAAGALGEYNGKFMCNQYVLRGGACVTPRSHVRATYRNFFYPHQRWQFGGLRLARNG